LLPGRLLGHKRVAAPGDPAGVQIEQVDPRDDAAFAEWFAVVEASQQHSRPGEVDDLPGDLQAAAVDGMPGDDGTPPQDEQYELLLVRHEERAVGAGRVELPLADNRHAAGVLLHVLPQVRRRGVGALLLAEVERRARRAGRTTLLVEIDEPPEEQGRSAGRAFAQRHGFTPVLVEVRRDLTLPVAPARLDALEAACAPYAQEYAIRSWRDRCPDDLVDDRAELGRRISTDAPLGELAWEEEQWDAARVRRREARVARSGRTSVSAGAVHRATGRLVAFTEVAASTGAPALVHQWETIVLREHRGHRLGTLVKTAVVRRLQKELPQARVVATCNADTNRHMIAVNQALGFRTNGLWVAFQRELRSDRSHVGDAAHLLRDVGLAAAARTQLDQVHGGQHQRAAEQQPQPHRLAAEGDGEAGRPHRLQRHDDRRPGG
jgi:GNAT superfamily N-acetyltransferase